MRNIRAAAVQFTHLPGDKSANLATIRRFVHQAVADHVELLVFPEMCITGYWHLRKLARDEIDALAEPIPSGTSTQTLRELAQTHEITLGAGLIERSPDGTLYNAYVVAMPDGQIARHRKLHCFISEHMASGSAYTVFDTPQGCRVGILICYDNNIGENVRSTALMGAEILLAPHQTGGCHTPSPRCMGLIDPNLWHQRLEHPEAIEAEFRGPKGREWLLRWLPARAHDNGLFLIFSNGVGIDENEVRTGNAMILDPYGEILAETWKAGDEMVVADLDAGLLERSTGRRWIRTRRPELYGLLTQSTGKEEDTRRVRFEKTSEATGTDFPP
ncbi:acyltransferase [candidate division KSB3 bacterium]|uniref:Acyltransferase n=1 Tax=candidate division KSB3 bacterium TaxID=2044937 RepID=A0A9D5JUI1_9BACT|nr:acyltransferase [candidate division KSB3 bacterium]MBD3323921.1 acyltransferase [candidate division KSB3 bacterium]